MVIDRANLVIATLVVIGVGLPLLAMRSMARYDDEQWAHIGRSRVGSMFIVCLVPWGPLAPVFALQYFVFIRRRLERF